MGAKIGVFICDCGGSIKNINFSAIEENLAKVTDVAHISLSSNLCLSEGREAMLSCIKDKNIKRVVIAACSPELKGGVFQQVLEGAGFNPYLLSVANIREQCSWAHEGDVTEKALVQIGMAINKARLLEPVERQEIPVNRDVLVVGGGLAGMKAAHELSRLGLKATLVEREPSLGGKLRELSGFYGLETSPGEMLEGMVKAVSESRDAEVLTSARVINVEGELGNFTVKIERGGEETSRNFGAIILATGYESRSYEAEVAANIITQSQLAELLKSTEKVENVPRNVGFLLDISAEHTRISTLSALNNALMLKENFGSEVYVFCRNLKIDSNEAERLYREVRNKGVLFFKFGEKPPQISQDGNRTRVQVEDILLGEEVVALCDLLIMDEKPLPPQGFEIPKVGLDSAGFYQEENVYLRPVASNRKGIFFAGGCHADVDISRALTDAANAALSAYELLSPGQIAAEVEKVKVDHDKCRLCLTCVRVCPHDAIRVVLSPERQTAQIFDLACDGCGICAAICPAKAIRFEGYSDEQILAEIEAIGSAYE
jgi:heterodisulfide reductase subunit A